MAGGGARGRSGDNVRTCGASRGLVEARTEPARCGALPNRAVAKRHATGEVDGPLSNAARRCDGRRRSPRRPLASCPPLGATRASARGARRGPVAGPGALARPDPPRTAWGRHASARRRTSGVRSADFAPATRVASAAGVRRGRRRRRRPATSVRAPACSAGVLLQIARAVQPPCRHAAASGAADAGRRWRDDQRVGLVGGLGVVRAEHAPRLAADVASATTGHDSRSPLPWRAGGLVPAARGLDGEGR